MLKVEGGGGRTNIQKREFTPSEPKLPESSQKNDSQSMPDGTAQKQEQKFSGEYRRLQILRTLDSKTATKSAPAVKDPDSPVNPGLTDKERAKLKSITDGNYDELPESAKDRRGPIAAAATRIIDESAKLSPKDQLKVLRRITNAPNEEVAQTVEAIDRIVGSRAYGKLSPADRSAAAVVIGAANREGLESLATISRRQPSQLADADKNGRSLISNLATLATQKINSDLIKANGAARTEILQAVLKDIAAPGKNIHQGDFNTCGVTDMQYELAVHQPSEYTRLMAGLAGERGSVDMRGGRTLDLQKDYLIPRNKPSLDGRPLSSRLMQTALLERIAADGLGDYIPAKDTVKYPIFGEYPGYNTPDAKRTMSELFGTQYVAVAPSLLALLRDPLVKPAESKLPIDYLKNFDRQTSGGPVIVDLVLKDMSTSHAVSLDRVENGYVYFRNPWQNGSYSNTGEAVAGDPGIYRMTIDEFQERTQGFLAPSNVYPPTPEPPMIGGA